MLSLHCSSRFDISYLSLLTKPLNMDSIWGLQLMLVRCMFHHVSQGHFVSLPGFLPGYSLLMPKLLTTLNNLLLIWLIVKQCKFGWICFKDCGYFTVTLTCLMTKTPFTHLRTEKRTLYALLFCEPMLFQSTEHPRLPHFAFLLKLIDEHFRSTALGLGFV